MTLFQRTSLRAARWLASFSRPKYPDLSNENRILSDALVEANQRENRQRDAYIERACELIEAKQMSGSGPWLVAESRSDINKPGKFRESNPLASQGAFGDLELALQNVEWRREVNLSWLEFSRWGIQQIILISRLYYIKNPIIRRLIDVGSVYVFGRGVEVSSPDEAANEAIAEMFERNRKTLGQIALVENEKRKYYDGNLFWACFADKANKGDVNFRLIDATEIQDIITDPDDTDTHWFYRRVWTQRTFDPVNGIAGTSMQEAYYPAIAYDPVEKPEVINGYPVFWEVPIYHRKCGAVGKWVFGCPIIYPALDWAKESRKYLEHVASVAASQAQIAWTLTTKGGQQALEGYKTQLQTTVGPSSSLWDQNPTANAGSTFASGPGTKLEAMKYTGQDPEKVRRYLLFCCMVVGVPETFLADVSTGNLATATTLDRPTELGFLEKQEAWREDLMVLTLYQLNISKGAPSGKIRASILKQNLKPEDVVIRETPRKRLPDGRFVYLGEAEHKPAKGTIEVKCTFPSIREGDIPALVKATVEAMTLDNRGGQIVGIDEKAGVRKLYELLGIEDGDELAEEQYPDGDYDPNRANQELTAPIGRSQPSPGGQPQINPKTGETLPPNDKKMEAALKRLGRAVKIWEASSERPNGHA